MTSAISLRSRVYSVVTVKKLSWLSMRLLNLRMIGWCANHLLTSPSMPMARSICWRRLCKYCPEAVFIFTSTNKVYGDTPNTLPLVELEERWEVDPVHPFAAHGIDESMSIDKSKHSLFGASKVAADVLVQEYGCYFGMKTGVFRGGCLTGPAHSGAELHGFSRLLDFPVRCVDSTTPSTVTRVTGAR